MTLIVALLALPFGLSVQDAASDNLRRWVKDLGSDDAEVREVASRKLVDLGEPARAALEECVRNGTAEARLRAQQILRTLDLRRKYGRRQVLLEFHAYPVGAFGRDADNTGALDAAAESIREALAKEKVKVLETVSDSRDSGKKATVHFNQTLVLDCQGRDPEVALKDIPHRTGGIVFEDGHYKQGLSRPKDPKRAFPAKHAFKVWGFAEAGQVQSDLARYRAIPGVDVEFSPPPLGSAGTAGSAKLTPKGDLTLLEVFVLTKTELGY